MSSITDVSSQLGKYMLKGWVLTDQSCPTTGCNVPLMRSPSGRTPVTHFCANCDQEPDGPARQSPMPPLRISDSSPSVSSGSRISRASTPPTEVSSTLSSPTFELPPETEESRRRRDQSDRASSEIGKRLLKGWAMLADECPNSQCIGVPLVRPPRAGGEKDPRKECVICGTIYITETDGMGQQQLVPDHAANDEQVVEPVKVQRTAVPLMPVVEEPLRPVPVTLHRGVSYGPAAVTADQLLNADITASALEASARALELTLHRLSGTLISLSNGQPALDLSSISQTADTIGKTTQALSHVRALQWSESQARMG